MPEGIVESISTSRTNKPVVRISGQDYYPGKTTDISTLRPGMRISMDTNSSEFRGKTYWYLNAWEPAPGSNQPLGTVVGAPQPPVPTRAQVPGLPPIAASGVPAAPEIPQLSRDEQMFAMAVLKSAIESGLIKTPEEMAPWVQKIRDICRFFA